MHFKDFVLLLKQYKNSKKCIHCAGYQGTMERLKKDGPEYFNEIEEADIYGFLDCTPCPPLELLEDYIKRKGRRLLVRPKTKKFSLEDFSVKLFLRKISGDF